MAFGHRAMRMCAGMAVSLVLSAGPAMAAAGTSSALPNQLGASVQLQGSLPKLGSVLHMGLAQLTAPATALVSLQHRDQPELLQLISEVSDPGSAEYRHYLSAAQFDARFAPTAQTVSDVESYLKAFGLTIVSVPTNHAYVRVTGNVGQITRAFDTQIGLYIRDGRFYQAPVKNLRVPRSLAGVITGVTGLDTGNIATPNIAMSSASSTVAPAVESASCISGTAAAPSTAKASNALDTPPYPAYVNAPPMSTYFNSCMSTAPADPAVGSATLGDAIQGYSAKQLEEAYGISGAIAAGLDGKGETVAVIDAYSSPTLTEDVDEWSKLNGLPDPKLEIDDNTLEEIQPDGPEIPTGVPILGGLNLQDPSDWFGEESLDVEAVHAMAPDATIIVQSSLGALGEELEMAQNDVVENDQAQEVSNSYGGSGAGGDSTDSTSDGYWQQAAAEGMGVEFSSGDDGDNTTGGTEDADAGVDTDPNSPYVTAVGGTTMAVGSGGKYDWETYWGEKTATLTNGAWSPLTYDGGGGGGVSEVYPEPSWQKPVVPNSIADYWQGNANAESTDDTIPGRVVPDVAMLADPNTGFLMGLTQDFSVYNDPDDTPLPTDGQAFDEFRIGGTSLSSPLFAGVMALADQAAGTKLGFVDPALYRLFTKDPSAFRDPDTTAPVTGVVRTNYVNNVSGTTQTVLRTFNNLATLKALPGYDDSTGLGSPNGLAFLCGLAPGSSILKSLSGAPCSKANTGNGPTTTATGSCKAGATLVFAQHPSGSTREVAAVVSVNGKVVKRVRGRKILKLSIRRPKAMDFTVKIVATLANGEVIADTISDRGCSYSSSSRVVRRASR